MTAPAPSPAMPSAQDAPAFPAIPTIPAAAGPAVIGDALELHGAVIVTGVMPAEQVALVRQALADLVAVEGPKQKEGTSVRTGELILKNPLFRAPLTDPLIVAAWRRVLGPDMVCSTWTGNTVLPGTGGILWHVDHPYWAMQQPFPTGCWLAGQTIWLLDDFTAANGATAIVPGSHLRPNSPDPRSEWFDDAQIVEAPAGSVLLAHGLFWHTSRRNTTTAPRHALLGMYARCVLVPMEDMAGQLARLTDASEEETQVLGGKAYRPRSIVT